jgi:hypothetical protein
MPENLTDAEEVRLLDLSWQNTDKLALVSVNGSDASAGTEVTGGSYARQTAAASAASTTSGVSTKVNSGALSFAAMPTTEVQGWELWDSAGSERKWYGLIAKQTGTAQNAGDTVTIAAHGYSIGQKVTFQAGFVPAGLSAGTTYFVVGATTNTFQVSTTSGGSAAAITADSALVVVGTVLDIVSGGAVSVAAGAVTLQLT